MSDDHIDDLERRLDEYWSREEEKGRRQLSAYPPEVIENAVRKGKGRWYHNQRLQADMMRARREYADAFAPIQPILARLDPVGYSGYPDYGLKTRSQSEAAMIVLRGSEVDSLATLERHRQKVLHLFSDQSESDSLQLPRRGCSTHGRSGGVGRAARHGSR